MHLLRVWDVLLQVTYVSLIHCFKLNGSSGNENSVEGTIAIHFSNLMPLTLHLFSLQILINGGGYFQITSCQLR